MVNMSVQYVRPGRKLLALRDEVYAKYNYTPVRAAEFVTGYKSDTNFSGHNADSNGIVHAVDIFTDDFGNLPQAEGRKVAEDLRQLGQSIGFAYLIHDMSEGSPQPMIAGQFNGWVWQDYYDFAPNGDPHSDHIHISMIDLYWGDYIGDKISSAVYDDSSPWGISGWTVSTEKPTPPVTHAPSKSISQLADETIAGAYGDGDARVNALGANYNAVQAEINRRFGADVVVQTKSISQLADETLAGLYGDGDSRMSALGVNYEAVQAEVNRRFGVGSLAPSKSISQLADETIAGAYGDGDTRVNALGGNYNAVQDEINRRFGAGSSVSQGPNISQLADETIAGVYGDGDARVAALGVNYDAVQAEVNRRYS